MTSSDHTTYPFATTNAQDFQNLLGVYMDAVLHPLLEEKDFKQEGWRIGPENPHGASSDLGPNAVPGKSSPGEELIFKGVVYNEMKGQMSDASYQYYVRFQEHIIPSLHNSGGDPPKITDLTHAQLKAFHAANYHPSNAKIFTYGDIPLGQQLKEIDKRLGEFERGKKDSSVRSPIDLSKGPQNATISGPVDPLVPAEKQYRTSTTWLLCNTSDIVERFSLGIMSSLLLDGYGSPLYQALVESGLGADFSPNTGFSAAGTSALISVGAIGVEEANVPKVKEAISKAFAEVHERGFDKIKVDGILHQLELGLKHKTAAFGMGIMGRVETDWFNGVDPIKSLTMQKTIDAFKKSYETEGYLESLLAKYLLNDNTFTFTMKPSESFGQNIIDEEKARLSRKLQEIAKDYASEAEARKQLVEKEKKMSDVLEASQEQDLSCLPTLRVQDIPRSKPKKPVSHSRHGNVRVQWREAPTNGLTYVRAINIFENLPVDLRQLIPLFSECIMRLGTKDLPMEKLEELIKLKTGGISVNYHSATSPQDPRQCEEGMAFSGTAFDRNIPALYDLIRTLVLETDFDSPSAEMKIQQMLQAMASSATDGMSESGHAYAMGYTLSSLTAEGELKEQTGGMSYVKLMTELARRTEPGSLRDVIERMKIIQNIALSKSNNFRMAITCGAESAKTNEADLNKFLYRLPGSVTNLTSSSTRNLSRRSAKTFFPLPYQVYYSGLSIPGVPYINSSGAALSILGHLLTHKHLHREIREKGGAYGGGASYSGLGGAFTFYSYRDPNPRNTLKVMRDSGAWAANQNFTSRDIEEAKLSLFKGVDSPESVSDEGMVEFATGIDYEMAQRRREQLLDVTAEDVRKAAEHFLIDGAKDTRIAVLGPKFSWWDELDWKQTPLFTKN